MCKLRVTPSNRGLKWERKSGNIQNIHQTGPKSDHTSGRYSEIFIL